MLENSHINNRLMCYMKIPERVLYLMVFIILIDLMILMAIDVFFADIFIIFWMSIIYYVLSYIYTYKKITNENKDYATIHSKSTHITPPVNMMSTEESEQLQNYSFSIFTSNMKVGILGGIGLVLIFLIFSLLAFYLSYISFINASEKFTGVYSFALPSNIAVASNALTIGIMILFITSIGIHKIFTGKYRKHVKS